MAIVYGEKATGQNGVLDHAELTAMIERKGGRRVNRGNCGTCATHIQDHKNLGAGGGVTTKFAGRSVFHISSGKRGGDDGCTVFYTLSEQVDSSKKGVLVAGIVAVGWHAGSNDHTYSLDWGKGPPFFTGGRLDTSVQHQKGA